MTRWSTRAALVLSVLWLVACGDERRRITDPFPDGDVLMFDAAMIGLDAGPPRDLGPRDAAADGPRVARDTCSVSADCNDDIACTTDVCTPAGTCSRTKVDAMCGAGQACVATTTGSGCGSGARCSGSPCDTVGGCGCASGQACVYVSGSPACRLAGAMPEGGICSSTIRCAPGLACLSPGGVAPSVCSPYCATGDDSGCNGSGSLCELDVPGHESDFSYPVRVCSRPCNPVDGVGCTSGTTCLLFGVTGVPGRYFTDCRPAGSGTQWSPCAGPSSCQPGYDCVDTREGSGFRCLHICRWDVFRADCPAGLACVYSAVPAATIDGQEYGQCGVF